MSRDLNSWLLPQNSSGYIVGFRGWFVRKEGLYSLVYEDCLWPIGRPLECETPLLCGRGGTYEGTTGGWMSLDRRVGIFAFKTLEQTLNSGFVKDLIGKVALWGEVAEHEEGYRAQYAYPLTLTETRERQLSREKGLEVAKLYGCKYIGEPS